jgi:peptide/nickel transport system substrate-binding protein
VVAVLAAEPVEVWSPGGLGFSPLGETVAAGLGNIDTRGIYFPELAEVIPTFENGLWKVLPDGRMETSWTIRERALWHDGMPLTTDDLLFSMRISQDPQAFPTSHPGFAFIDSAQAVDGRTIVVKWKSPYTGAERMFSRSAGGNPLAFPWPKHILEKVYLENKPSFAQDRYWSTEFVGAGPFRVAEWVLGSHWLLSAHQHYVLGRPKVDEIEMRFMADAQALVASILAGDAHVTVGGQTPVTPSDSVELKKQWSGGRVLVTLSGATPILPQLLNPQPAVVGEVQLRRALSHAIDKQGVADSIMAGTVPPQYGNVDLNHPAGAELERSLVKYEYDPRRAVQLIQGLGYTQGPGGGFRDPSGQELSVPLRGGSGSPQDVALGLIVVDYWKQVGVAATIDTETRRGDLQWAAEYPAFLLRRFNVQLSRLVELHSSEARTAVNNFSGANLQRYHNADLDSLIERFQVAIPVADRYRLAAQIVHHLSDQVVFMGLVYNARVALVTNRLQNYTPGNQPADVPSPHLWQFE